MEIKQIKTENPSEHWGFLECDGRTVLDLGHGIWEQDTEPTPIYFLKEKATLVVGVDPSQPSYNWYKDNLKTERFVQHNDYIDGPNKFQMYLRYYRPHVVKCDIEGSEIYMGNLTKEDFETVREMGIEYHSLACRIVIENMATEWGFNIEDKYQLMDINPGGMGVIHLKKPKEVTIKLRKNGNQEENNG
jgi:phage anti-repressor protein